MFDYKFIVKVFERYLFVVACSFIVNSATMWTVQLRNFTWLVAVAACFAVWEAIIFWLYSLCLYPIEGR